MPNNLPMSQKMLLAAMISSMGAGVGAAYGGVTSKLPGESRLRRILTSAAAGGAGGATVGFLPRSDLSLTAGVGTSGAIKGLLSPKREGESHSRLKNVARGTAKGVVAGGISDLGNYLNKATSQIGEPKVMRAIRTERDYNRFISEEDRQKLQGFLDKYEDAVKGPSELKKRSIQALLGAGAGAIYGGVSGKLPGESRLRRIFTSAAAGGAGGAAYKHDGNDLFQGAGAGAITGATKGLLNPVDNTKSTGGKLKERAKNTALGGLKGGTLGAGLNFMAMPKGYINSAHNIEKLRRIKNIDRVSAPVLKQILDGVYK